MSKAVRIITAHDGARYYADMAETAKRCAKRQGYNLEIEKTINVKHSKARILTNALTEEWAIWMDSDSILMGRIDELFKGDYDIALVVQESKFQTPKFKSNKYGAYLYSGFVVAHNTKRARQFLSEWDQCPQTQPSDQKNLCSLFEDHLDSSIYSKIGKIIEINGLRILLLDPNIYCHRQAIHDMKPPVEGIKIIHFIVRLHRKWPQYKRLINDRTK